MTPVPSHLPSVIIPAPVDAMPKEPAKNRRPSNGTENVPPTGKAEAVHSLPGFKQIGCVRRYNNIWCNHFHDDAHAQHGGQSLNSYECDSLLAGLKDIMAHTFSSLVTAPHPHSGLLYSGMQNLRALESCIPGGETPIHGGTTPLSHSKWEVGLRDHPDRAFADYI